jgi:hypothetical protein
LIFAMSVGSTFSMRLISDTNPLELKVSPIHAHTLAPDLRVGIGSISNPSLKEKTVPSNSEDRHDR